MGTISERIKEVRKVAGLTQREFADRIGAKQNTIAQYEIGRNVPIDPVINSICREFCVNENWLRTGEGEPFKKETRQEQIMQFAKQTVNGSDEFRKAFVSMLAKMDADDWKALAKLFDGLTDEIRKSNGTAPVLVKNIAAARSGDRMEAAQVTKEEEDAVLPPLYTGDI